MYSYIHPLLSRNKGNKIENNGDHLQHEPTKRWLLLTLELSPGEHPWKRWHDDLPKGTTGLNLDHIYQKIRVTFNKLYVFLFTTISLVGCDVPPKYEAAIGDGDETFEENSVSCKWPGIGLGGLPPDKPGWEIHSKMEVYSWTYHEQSSIDRPFSIWHVWVPEGNSIFLMALLSLSNGNLNPNLSNANPPESKLALFWVRKEKLLWIARW